MASEKTLELRIRSAKTEAWHRVFDKAGNQLGTGPKGKPDRRYERDSNGAIRRIPRKVRMSKKARLLAREKAKTAVA